MTEPIQLGAISWLPDGRMLIEIDDPVAPYAVEIRRPTWGKFKRLSLAWDEARAAYSERSQKHADDLAAAQARIEKLAASKKEAAMAEAIDRARTDQEDLLQWGYGMQVFWWRLVSDLLARGEGLPADHDEWPAELIVSSSVITETMQHWKFVPWDRGQSDRPLPAKL